VMNNVQTNKIWTTIINKSVKKMQIDKQK